MCACPTLSRSSPVRFATIGVPTFGRTSSQLGWEPAINEYATDRPIADPEQAARKLMEIASTVEPVKDGRLHIEKINAAVRRVRRG
jgi:hypothetical protein